MISFLSKLRDSEASWSLLDQAAVSGGNFLTTLVLARILSPTNYGTFSLLFLSLYAINTCHGSLVVYPLILNVAGGKEEEFRHLNGTAFLHTLALSLPFAAVLAGVTFFLHRMDIWPFLVLAMVGWQVQESARRTLLSGLRSRAAFLPDLVCYVGQGVLLLVLHSTNFVVIFLVMAVTSAVAALWQFALVRFSLAKSFALEPCRYAWKIGRFILAGNALNMATLQVPSWTLALAAGPLSVAGYQSLLNLVGVANPIMFSVASILIPAVARGSLRGQAEARQTMYHYGARYGLLLLPCFLILLAAPSSVMHLVYGAGSAYLPLAPLLRPFVLAFALQYLATVIGAYEGGMERPKTYMWVQIAGTGVLVTAGVGLIYAYGVKGAVLGMLLASAIRFVTFALISRAADRRMHEAGSNSLPGDAPMSGPVQMQVCLLTYKRPQLLRETLLSLRSQVISDPQLTMHILVVDNDVAGSGWETFRRALEDSPIPSRYVCEPGRGIGNARNRALRESAGMDYIAFIDDDEVATPEWLQSLYQTMQRSQADIVTGPVTPRFVEAPEWIVQGGFFRMSPQPTGSVVECVATNNVLFRAELATRYTFDSRFDATGGEDTHLFMRMKRDGLRPVWCQEAEVIETVPGDRTKVKWMLQRAQSDANRYTRCCLDLDRGAAIRIQRLGKALLGFGAGVLLLPAGLLQKQHAVRGLQWIYRAMGTCSALWGARTIYYAPTPALVTPSASVGEHLDS
jgi:O-antigen/teichoic acid export membrane protein